MQMLSRYALMANRHQHLMAVLSESVGIYNVKYTRVHAKPLQ